MSMTMGKKTETPTTQPTPAPTAPPLEEIGPTCTQCTAGSCACTVFSPAPSAFDNDSLKAAMDGYTDDTKKEATITQYGPIECW
jgi:hypothetical protein